MADLDTELSKRLSQLAAAVPVSSGGLDPVHRGAVEARQRVRMAWVTPLVFVVAAALIMTAVGVGPFADLGNGAVSATTRVGDFELTIRSARSHYVAGEPIDVSATLTYLGSGSPIAIGHEFGKDGAPIGFGVAEPIFPGYVLSGEMSRLMCHRTAITPGTPIVEAFRKSGAGSGDAVDFSRYMNDPVFWLNEGTWHPNAIASFSINPSPPGSCGSDIKLEVEIAITVGPRSTESASGGPSSPSPAKLGTERWRSSVQGGGFELALDAVKETFSADETLDVVGSLTYLGPDPRAVIGNDVWAQSSSS